MPYRHTHRERQEKSRSSRVLDPAAFLGAALLLAGCGLKGPLYLPEDRDQATVPVPAESSAPAQDPAADTRKRVITLPPAPQSQKNPAREDRAADPAETPNPAPGEPASAPPASQSGQAGEQPPESSQPDA